MHIQKRFANRAAKFLDKALGLELHPLKENLSRQRISIRVQSIGGQSNDGVAGPDAFAVNDP